MKLVFNGTSVLDQTPEIKAQTCSCACNCECYGCACLQDNLEQGVRNIDLKGSHGGQHDSADIGTQVR